MKIFLSYSHQNKAEADHIDQVLQETGYQVVRDIREVGYKEDLYKYCDRIRDCQVAVCLVSDAYLKSRWCMYEILQLMKEQQFDIKFFPVVFDDADIFNPKNRIQYVHYWNKEYDDLSDAVKKLKPHQTTNLAVDLKLLLYIGTEIDDFTAGQAGVYTPKFDDLKENNFQDIIKTISPPEETSLQQLTKLMAAQYLAELNKKLHDGEYVPLELESGTIPEKKEQDEKEDSRQHMHG